MTGEPEWDSEDSHRHQNRREQGSEALDYTLAGNLEDASRSVAVLDDADLVAMSRALRDLKIVCANEISRRRA